MPTTITTNISGSLPQQKHYRTDGVDFFKHSIESILETPLKGLSFFATSNLYNTADEFASYLYLLDSKDRREVEASVNEIKSYPFVESVEFKNCSAPTVTVNLTEVNREHEKKIYAIEYHLLRETNANINFDIDFS